MPQNTSSFESISHKNAHISSSCSHVSLITNHVNVKCWYCSTQNKEFYLNAWAMRSQFRRTILLSLLIFDFSHYSLVYCLLQLMNNRIHMFDLQLINDTDYLIFNFQTVNQITFCVLYLQNKKTTENMFNCICCYAFIQPTALFEYMECLKIAKMYIWNLYV